ncbi:TPA: FadR family transcriptional regulator [Candidatus Bipolaricaulota bacterium]|nr:FadR family transcriptional regulator [Candidatus Bipolaricaulota bacterium]
MKFEKVRPAKASSAVAQQVLQAIKSGVFPVGSRLPPEAELAQLMGVSRPTVREALAALAAVGVIEARPGIGNFVANPTDSIVREALVLLENEASCLEIMEARGLLEPPVAAAAAVKRTPEDLKRLEDIFHRLVKLAHREGFERYFDTDKEFHLALVAAAGNDLLASALIPLINTMDQHLYREFTRKYYFRDEQGISSVAELHGRILEAVEAGDSKLAARTMRDHWARMWRLVQDGDGQPEHILFCTDGG